MTVSLGSDESVPASRTISAWSRGRFIQLVVFLALLGAVLLSASIQDGPLAGQTSTIFSRNPSANNNGKSSRLPYLRSSDTPLQPIISGCLGPFYGTKVNPRGVMAWLKYYEERWGLTHVDMHIRQDDFETTSTRLMQVYNEAIRVGFIQNVHITLNEVANFAESRERHKAQFLLINRCHDAALARGSDFYINFDADEYLVSDDFRSLHQLFDHYNKTVVSFPVFNVHYGKCAAHKPTFDSATYRYVIPIGSERDTEHPEQVYIDPPPDAAANRKYIVRGGGLVNIHGVHSPLFDGDKSKTDEIVKYLMGRGRDTKILHFRTSVGIHADEREFLCNWTSPGGPKTCPWFAESLQTCVNNISSASLVYDETEVHQILKDVPLTEPAIDMYREATCYANRYENLKETHCTGDDALENCNYKQLYNHYVEEGKAQNLIFNCTTPVTDVDG